MKKLLFFAFTVGFAFNSIAESPIKKTKPSTEKPKVKEKIQIWCEIRGVYSKVTHENGVVSHVCSFVSNTAICYIVKCGEWNDVGTIQSNVAPGIDIPEGQDFIAIPTQNGYEIIYFNGHSYSVENNVLTITPN